MAQTYWKPLLNYLVPDRAFRMEDSSVALGSSRANKGELRMYDAEISRSQPTTYLFLVDQSGSMSDQMGSSQRSKAQFVADVLNKTLRDLVVRWSTTCTVAFFTSRRTLSVWACCKATAFRMRKPRCDASGSKRTSGARASGYRSCP
jgi:hypothetical protein